MFVIYFFFLAGAEKPSFHLISCARHSHIRGLRRNPGVEACAPLFAAGPFVDRAPPFKASFFHSQICFSMPLEFFSFFSSVISPLAELMAAWPVGRVLCAGMFAFPGFLGAAKVR